MAEKQRKLLIAVDSSGNSLAAFNYYLNSVSYPTDQVVLVHMFNPPNPPVMSSKNLYSVDSVYTSRHPFGHDLFLSDPNNEQWVNWRKNVDKAVEEYKKLLSLYEGYCDERKISRMAVLHSGTPGEGVCELANKHDVDLIIMGTRGLNKIRRTLLGSVSDYVIHHAKKPVLVIPNQNE